MGCDNSTSVQKLDITLLLSLNGKKISFILRVTICKMFIGILQDLWDLVEMLTLKSTHLYSSVIKIGAWTSSYVTTSFPVFRKIIQDGLYFWILQSQNHRSFCTWRENIHCIWIHLSIEQRKPCFLGLHNYLLVAS